MDSSVRWNDSLICIQTASALAQLLILKGTAAPDIPSVIRTVTFPYYFTLFGYAVHPHAVLELAGYTVGTQWYLRTRDRWKHPALPRQETLIVLCVCVFGALIGSKLL